MPAGLGRTRRPTRSVSWTPSSRPSADTAADTDGCETTSSSAAAVTEPVRTTARKLRSCVTVTAICLSVRADPSGIAYVSAPVPTRVALDLGLHQGADPGFDAARGRRALAGPRPP